MKKKTKGWANDPTRAFNDIYLENRVFFNVFPPNKMCVYFDEPNATEFLNTKKLFESIQIYMYVQMVVSTVAFNKWVVQIFRR
jgi:hypothetical protein